MRCHQLLFIVDYMKSLHFLETKIFIPNDTNIKFHL